MKFPKKGVKSCFLHFEGVPIWGQTVAECGRVGVKGTEGSSEGESLAGFHCKANAGADSAGEARTFVFKSLALKITK